MEENLISFKTAKLAKEKGFNETTSGAYTKEGILWKGNARREYFAPTQSLLQKWLREKHNLHIYIESTPVFDKMQGGKWKCVINYCFQPFKWTTGKYYLADTYEECLEKGLLIALNLIT